VRAPWYHSRFPDRLSGTDLQANFSEVLIQKAGPERYVLLPYNDQDSLQPGDYYIAVVGEGVNPSDNSRTGTGTSSGVLASNGPLNSVAPGNSEPLAADAGRRPSRRASEGLSVHGASGHGELGGPPGQSRGPPLAVACQQQPYSPATEYPIW